METIYFYAPGQLRQQHIEREQNKWQGFHSNFTAWIAQTYFHLKNAGFPCQVAD